MMKESVLDVLMYLFESYVESQMNRSRTGTSSSKSSGALAFTTARSSVHSTGSTV